MQYRSGTGPHYLPERDNNLERPGRVFQLPLEHGRRNTQHHCRSTCGDVLVRSELSQRPVGGKRQFQCGQFRIQHPVGVQHEPARRRHLLCGQRIHSSPSPVQRHGHREFPDRKRRLGVFQCGPVGCMVSKHFGLPKPDLYVQLQGPNIIEWHSREAPMVRGWCSCWT